MPSPEQNAARTESGPRQSIPVSTYRLQLRNGVTFDDAAKLTDYLNDLGISHLYLSPILTAVPGSPHGYDVASFSELDPTLGGAAGFERLSATLRSAGLHLIVDFVPNHMAASPFNPWWRDVLEWGAASHFAQYLDIDWHAPKLLAPVLGESYGDALANGRFGLRFDPADGGISFNYGAVVLPLTPPSYAAILRHIEEDPFPELARRFVSSSKETADSAKAELAAAASIATVRTAVEHAVGLVAADQDALHQLLEAQVWRVTHWRMAREGLTYRRFFEIADLVGVRVERPPVFDDAHALLLELVRRGNIQGIRLDHIDGLADPRGYLASLQSALDPEHPFYLVVEKILGKHERLRSSWPVAGTTGYEFISALAGVLVDPAGEEALTDAYQRFVGQGIDYPVMTLGAKRSILARNLAGELEFLRDLARDVAERYPSTRDYGPDSLRRAIIELAAVMPVYRTYVAVEGPDETDLEMIASAVEAAKTSRQVEDEGAIDFIGRLLRLEFSDPEGQAAALTFAIRFQQTTGPVMAKAVEDTVFYRYNRLVALNEVGGEPDVFGEPVSAFHDAMAARLVEQPSGLTTTATHDTKRGEDARARLYAISEMPEAWGEAVESWDTRLARGRTVLDGHEAPEREVEWMFYQALAGAWPSDLSPQDRTGVSDLGERIQAFMLKAVRETKFRTSWASPSVDYEDAIGRFTSAAFEDVGFLEDFIARARPLMLAGAVTSLAQLAIKLIAPGAPDIYQGTEFWDLSLVDPDNRRPVDFAARREALAAIEETSPADLIADWHSGAMKLRVLRAGLRARKARPRLFAEGEYIPLEATGRRAGNVLAFARRSGDEICIVVVPRLVAKAVDHHSPKIDADFWGDTTVRLPGGTMTGLHNAITGGAIGVGDGTLGLAELLGSFPVAILINR